jgi:carbamoyl-phosphate synthase large subunit
VPYISKVTGVPMVDLATRAMLGEKLGDMGFGTGLYKTPPYVAVKVPVFSFEKLADVDNLLDPEMKSTGEVLGIGKTREEALYKGLVAAGYNMKRRGGLLVTVRDSDKIEMTDAVRKFYGSGFRSTQRRVRRRCCARRAWRQQRLANSTNLRTTSLP